MNGQLLSRLLSRSVTLLRNPTLSCRRSEWLRSNASTLSYSRLVRSQDSLPRSRLPLGSMQRQLAPEVSKSPLVGPHVREFHVCSLNRSVHPPTAEQQTAIDILLETRQNLVFNACAGSGKTTSILHLAKAAPHMKFLVMMYNRRLADETKEKVHQEWNLENVEVRTYHSLGRAHYTTECSTDQGLKRVVMDDMPFIADTLPDFDVLVLDEQQDMTPAIKSFMDKFLSDTGLAKKNLRVVALGDPRQELYGYSNADYRFLTFVSKKEVFGYLNGEAWKEIDLSTSRRLSESNAKLINKVILKPPPGKEIRAARKDGEGDRRPRYVVLDIFNPEETVEELQILTSSYKHADILVLAPSVRTPGFRKLADEAASRNIPVHLADSDYGEIDPAVSEGKVLFCSFHQSKGIERDAGIIFGFDASYHRFFDKVPDSWDSGSNPIYVGATRMKRQLVLLHHYKERPLPYAPDPEGEELKKLCDVVFRSDPNYDATPAIGEGSKPVKYLATALVRNVPDEVINRCLSKLDLVSVAPPMRVKDSSSNVEDVYGLRESITDITGTAVTGIIEFSRSCSGSMPFLLYEAQRIFNDGALLGDLKERYLDQHKRLYSKFSQIKDRWEEEGTLSIPDILFLANLLNSSRNQYFYKLLTIRLHGYDWMKAAEKDDIIQTLHYIPRRGVIYEHKIEQSFPDIKLPGGPDGVCRAGVLAITGYLDFVCKTQQKLWENKHATQLQPKDILQTVLYKALIESNKPDHAPMEAFLGSSKSGQLLIVRLKPGFTTMDIVQDLVFERYGGNGGKKLKARTDEDFLKQCDTRFPDFLTEVQVPMWFNMAPREDKIAHRFKKYKARQGLVD